jgi:hypothetical protein
MLVNVTAKGNENVDDVVRLNMLLTATKLQVTCEGAEHPALVSPKSGGNFIVSEVNSVELELAKLINKLLEDNKNTGLLKLYEEIPKEPS